MIAREREPLHHRHACRAYLDAKEELRLPTDHVPLLAPITGFRYLPIAGLAPAILRTGCVHPAVASLGTAATAPDTTAVGAKKEDEAWI